MKVLQVADKRERVRVTGRGVVFGRTTPLGMLARVSQSGDWFEVSPGARLSGPLNELELLFPSKVANAPLDLFVFGDPEADLIEPARPLAHRIETGKVTLAFSTGVQSVELPSVSALTGECAGVFLRGAVECASSSTLPFVYLYASTPNGSTLLDAQRTIAVTNKNKAICPIKDWIYPLDGGTLRIENATSASARECKYDLWLVTR